MLKDAFLFNETNPYVIQLDLELQTWLINFQDLLLISLDVCDQYCTLFYIY